MDIATLKARVESLLIPFNHNSLEDANKAFQGTLTVLSAVHGDESLQVKALIKSVDQAQNKRGVVGLISHEVSEVAIGAIKNLKEEIDAGVLGSLQKRFAGDVLTDFIQLARAILENKGDDAKNVASVLAAAAFEDTIRRMGSTFAGVIGRDKLDEVIEALKNNEILQAPQLGIAISYLNFRNHALHADWQHIDRAGVISVLGFVEQLLLKHFQ